MFTTQEALDIFRSVEKLSKILGIDDNKLLAKIYFLDNEMKNKLKKALEIYNRFVEADFETRASMLGVKFKKHDDGSYTSEHILSEST